MKREEEELVNLGEGHGVEREMGDKEGSWKEWVRE